jgi:hypothetical protein
VRLGDGRGVCLKKCMYGFKCMTHTRHGMAHPPLTPPRIWRLLSDPLARTPYGQQHGTCETPLRKRNEGAMRIPRPAVEKLGAFREDPVIHV